MDIFKLLGIFLSLIWFSIPCMSYSRCYYPNGTIAIGDTPCSNWEEATCCMEGYSCLSNNICMAQEDSAVLRHGLYARGSCTDQSWVSDVCLHVCINSGAPDYDYVDRAQPIGKCYDYPDANMYYCDNQDLSSVYCNNRTNVFWFANANSTVPIFVNSTQSSISPSKTTSASTHTGSLYPTDNWNSTFAIDDYIPEESGLSKGAIAGIVIGSVAFLACIGGLAFFLYRRWRRQKGEPLNPQHSSHPGPSELYTADPSVAPHAVGSKVGKGELYEVPADESQRYEAPGDESHRYEVPGDESHRYEVPGDETRRYELPG